MVKKVISLGCQPIITQKKTLRSRWRRKVHTRNKKVKNYLMNIEKEI